MIGSTIGGLAGFAMFGLGGAVVGAVIGGTALHKAFEMLS